MAVFTGLVLQAKLDAPKSALVAIVETESRHNIWGLVDISKANPFTGPSDTIWESTKLSLCPTRVQRPPSPRPSQKTPPLSSVANQTISQPWSMIIFDFSHQQKQPYLDKDVDYNLVTFHGPVNISALYDSKTSSVIMPSKLKGYKGIIIIVLASAPGAPALDSVVAGPLVLTQF
jgi:hypothetical protein